MQCQEDSHIWDIFWISNKTTFESRLKKEYLREDSELKSISICRKCKRISIYNELWELIIKETNLIHQGNKVYLKKTATRTCKGCLYSSQDKGSMCHKPFNAPKCMVDGEEFIFILIF